MNKNLREVLVRVEYKDQIWFKVISEQDYVKTFKRERYSEEARRDYKRFDEQSSSESHSILQECFLPRRLLSQG